MCRCKERREALIAAAARLTQGDAKAARRAAEAFGNSLTDDAADFVARAKAVRAAWRRK